jgi:hypothetical protein
MQLVWRKGTGALGREIFVGIGVIAGERNVNSTGATLRINFEIFRSIDGFEQLCHDG